MSEIKEIPKPGYTTDKPVLKAIKQIKKLIGDQDSCIQLNEVAVLFFEEQAIASGNQDEFIEQMCTKFTISRGSKDLEHFKITNYKSYIVQTYNLVEPSFKKLNKQYRHHNDFSDNWKTKDGDKSLDPFNQLAVNLPPSKQSLLKSYPEYYLFNYYRLIRNSIVHLQDDDDENTKTQKYFDEFLKDKLEFFKENYHLQVPNEPDKISFDDFMLFTRALKYFSNILNNICFPDIKSMVSTASKDEQLKKTLYARRDIGKKGVLGSRINALKSYFIGHFGGKFNELEREFCRHYLTTEKIDYDGYLE